MQEHTRVVDYLNNAQCSGILGIVLYHKPLQVILLFIKTYFKIHGIFLQFAAIKKVHSFGELFLKALLWKLSPTFSSDDRNVCAINFSMKNWNNHFSELSLCIQFTNTIFTMDWRNWWSPRPIYYALVLTVILLHKVHQNYCNILYQREDMRSNKTKALKSNSLMFSDVIVNECFVSVGTVITQNGWSWPESVDSCYFIATRMLSLVPTNLSPSDLSHIPADKSTTWSVIADIQSCFSVLESI